MSTSWTTIIGGYQEAIATEGKVTMLTLNFPYIMITQVRVRHSQTSDSHRWVAIVALNAIELFFCLAINLRNYAIMCLKAACVLQQLMLNLVAKFVEFALKFVFNVVVFAFC